MIETRQVKDPRAEKLREAEQARVDRLDGLLEYVAMMADVELPETDEEERHEHE